MTTRIGPAGRMETTVSGVISQTISLRMVRVSVWIFKCDASVNYFTLETHYNIDTKEFKEKWYKTSGSLYPDQVPDHVRGLADEHREEVKIKLIIGEPKWTMTT